MEEENGRSGGKKEKFEKECLGDWVYSFLVKILLNPIIKTNSKVVEK